MKKFIILILCFILCFGSCIGAFAEPFNCGTFYADSTTLGKYTGLVYHLHYNMYDFAIDNDLTVELSLNGIDYYLYFPIYINGSNYIEYDGVRYYLYSNYVSVGQRNIILVDNNFNIFGIFLKISLFDRFSLGSLYTNGILDISYYNDIGLVFDDSDYLISDSITFGLDYDAPVFESFINDISVFTIYQFNIWQSIINFVMLESSAIVLLSLFAWLFVTGIGGIRRLITGV